MDIMSDSDFFGEVEHMVSDDSFSDILGDVETFSDSHSESDWSDIGILDNIQDTMIYDWSNEAYLTSLNNNENNKSKSLYTLEPTKPSVSPSSPFDTNNFPTSVNDISNLIEIEPNFKFDNFYTSEQDSLDVSYNITVPVIKVEEVVIEDEDIEEDKEEEEEAQFDNPYQPKNLLKPSKRRHQRKYSSTDDTESDEEWEPEAPKQFRRKQPSSRRISICRSPSQRPVPQRRSPGTKLKITQWIVELLRNPKYNPKVITWVDEKHGVFMIKDTVAYARLWGKFKHNDKMTYEKLSRAMR